MKPIWLTTSPLCGAWIRYLYLRNLSRMTMSLDAVVTAIQISSGYDAIAGEW